MTKIVGALFLTLVAVPCPAVTLEASPDGWSEPEIVVQKMTSGMTQKIEISRRNHKAGSERIIEKRMLAQLKAKKSTGRYQQLKKQVYANNKLVTVYRTVDADVQGEADFAWSEKSQIAKTDIGVFKGTMIREYICDPAQNGPAVRLLLRFDHYMMVTSYNARLYIRQENGSWPLMATVRADSLERAIYDLQFKLEKSGKPHAFADYILALWAATAAQGPIDLSRLIHPILNPGGELYLHDKPIDPILRRVSDSLSQFDQYSARLKQWRNDEELLKQTRTQLKKDLLKARSKPNEKLSRSVQSYLGAVQNLLIAPPKPATSSLENLHENLERLAFSYRELQENHKLHFLVQDWAKKDADFKAEIYWRSLYVLLLSRETRALNELIAAAESNPTLPVELPKSLKQASQVITEGARAWRTVALKETQADNNFLSWLGAPHSWLASSGWAEEPVPGFSAYYEALSGISSGPFSLPTDQALAQMRLTEIVTTLPMLADLLPRNRPLVIVDGSNESTRVAAVGIPQAPQRARADPDAMAILP